MISRRLLYLNTHRLSAYAWEQGRLQPEGVFESGEEELERFSDYLADRGKCHFYLLANVAEEAHTLDSIPFLRGGDRQTLIARKISQHFLGTPLATAISLGYERTTRKNEKLLLSALTNPEHFAPWLNRINSAGVPLAGIYTVAQLGGLLLKKLGYGNERCLLLTVQDHSIRESFLVDGQAHFSRMAPLNDSSIAGMASALSTEAGKLHQYLVGQRLVGRDEILPVYILAHPLAVPAIEQACPERPHLTFRILDSLAAASRLQLKTLATDSRSENLFLHLLAVAAPNQQFASDAHRHDFRLTQIRQALIGVGVVALLGSVLFAAKGAYQTNAFREETRALNSAEADLDRRYQEIAATFPRLDIDNDTLRRLTDRYQGLRQQQRQPGPALRTLSQALDQMPAIQLESLAWKVGSDGAAKLPGAIASESAGNEITTVKGAIRLADNASTRQVLQTLEHFTALLRSDPANQVNVTQPPIDIESGRILRGGDEAEDRSRPRLFTIEISRKLAP